LIYCVDVDGTICTTAGTDYSAAEPIPARIAKINELFDAGHEIVYFTARGSFFGVDHSELTRGQLELWGAKFTRLVLGKPAADVYIDDRAVSDAEFFADDAGQQHLQGSN